MSWILVLSVVLFAVAVGLIELRAIRTGDERRHTAPGFVFVTCGVFLLAIGIAAAVAGDELVAIASSSLGLVSVALGASAHRHVSAH